MTFFKFFSFFKEATIQFEISQTNEFIIYS